MNLNLILPSRNVTCFITCSCLWMVHGFGYCFWDFEKSKVFNLRCQKVWVQCKSYLKLLSYGINIPLTLIDLSSSVGRSKMGEPLSCYQTQCVRGRVLWTSHALGSKFLNQYGQWTHLLTPQIKNSFQNSRNNIHTLQFTNNSMHSIHLTRTYHFVYVTFI